MNDDALDASWSFPEELRRPLFERPSRLSVDLARLNCQPQRHLFLFFSLRDYLAESRYPGVSSRLWITALGFLQLPSAGRESGSTDSLPLVPPVNITVLDRSVYAEASPGVCSMPTLDQRI